jgi:predicted GNAT family acetyltransferase
MNAVVHNHKRHRYELTMDGHTAVSVYNVDGDILSFVHTEVPPELGGRGVGTRLIEAALADVRERSLKVRPLCGFVKQYMDRHPETADLLAN